MNHSPALAGGLEQAGPAHAMVMATIHSASFPPAEQWRAEAFATLLAQPGVFAVVDPVGGFLLGRIAGEEAEILTLAVSPPARRQGRGRALLTHGIAEAASRGASVMFLEVSADNAAAHALYANAGFREVGRRPAYYPLRETAIVLRAELTAYEATTA